MLFYFISMKVCNKCKEEKELIYFGKRTSNKDGLRNSCKNCEALEKTLYDRTKKGKLRIIYFNQVHNSISKGNEEPNYTRKEFVDKYLNDLDFERHYYSWVISSYCKKYSPSFDRVDDYKSYSFDNIQIMYWYQNKNKGHLDIKEGRNNKRSKAVIGTNIKTGYKIEFHSSMEAERNGFNHSNIVSCCKGNRNSHKGYTWEHKH